VELSVRFLRQLIRSRPRLAMSMLAGVAIAILLPWHPHIVTRLLIAWNFAIWSYLILIGWLMARATPEQVRGIAEKEDETGLIVLAVLSVAAVASIVAIVAELATIKGTSGDVRLLHYLLTGATVFGTWFFMGTLFTFHYARVFYQAKGGMVPLFFPEGELHPDYWDFLYFSFTIAAASQTGDVNLMTRSVRKTALAQMVLSFFFNVSILGLSINIAAGLIGS
jgi:uncharacterized membrane protein